MGKLKRQARLKKKKKENQEEELYQDEPGQESEEFFHDDVDKYFVNREKILLNTDEKDEDSNEEEEDFEDVIGLGDDDSDSSDDDEVTDDEDENENNKGKGLPSDEAWGKKISSYYSVDEIGENIESDEEAKQLAEEEEEEAMLIQKRLAAVLDEEDFDTQDFQLETKSGDDSDDFEGEDDVLKEKALVQKDLTKLSKNEKLEILVKDSPELLELLEEFRKKMQVVLVTLQPLIHLARTGKIPEQGLQYLEVRHQLYLNYCINIGFYLLLKARQAPVKDHPVIGKLVQYRMLIKELEPLDEKLEPEIQALLQQQEGPVTDDVSQLAKTSQKPKLSALLDDVDGHESVEPKNEKEHLTKKKRKSKPQEEAKEDLIDPLAYYEQIKLAKKRKKEEKEKMFRLARQPEYEDQYEAVMVDGKRSVTYEISKNKGLTPRKKKELRNPRVKLKKKFQKAVIKRKSQVRPVVTELQRYGGETTGVRSNLVRSVKIK